MYWNSGEDAAKLTDTIEVIISNNVLEGVTEAFSVITHSIDFDSDLNLCVDSIGPHVVNDIGDEFYISKRSSLELAVFRLADDISHEDRALLADNLIRMADKIKSM